MKKLLLIIISILIYSQIISQIESYPKYNYNDGTNMPFDKEFDLMIPFSAKDSIYHTYLYRHKGNRTFHNSLKNEKSPLPKVALDGDWYKNKSDTNYYVLKFRYQDTSTIYTLLKPARNYSLISFRGISAGSKNILKALSHEYQETKTIIDTGSAHKVFQKERNRQDSINKIVTYSDKFDDYKNFYITEYYPIEQLLKNKIELDLNYKYNCNPECFKQDCTEELLNLLFGNKCSISTLNCVDTCKIKTIILGMYRIECDSNILHFIKGLTTFDNWGDPDKIISTNKYKLRKSNIVISLSELNSIYDFIIVMQSQVSETQCAGAVDCFKQLNKCLLELINELKKSNKRIDEIVKNTSELELLKIESRLFIDYTVSEFDSYVYNFQVRNDLAITPVFGYAFYGFQEGFTGFAPYLGFQINFQGVNRETPFNQIRKKTLWQRTGFTTAWTLTGIEEKNKRSDLFKNSSLITALGFKVSHICMLNGGVMWFKREDPNTLETNQRLAITPVLSLSLNLEVEKLLNGFTKLFPIK